MTRLINTAARLAAVIFTATIVSACGGSSPYGHNSQPVASQAGPVRKIPAISLSVHRLIQRAQEQMDLKNLAGAKAILEQVLARKSINNYERSVAWQFTAMIAFEEDDTLGAIRAFEQMLRYKDSIPVALELSIMYNLSQLYYTVEDFDPALQYVKDWEARSGEFVGVSAMSFISQLHYVRNEFPQAIEYIDLTIALAQTLEDVEVKENWYALKLSAQWETKNYDGVKSTLDQLLAKWPKSKYCVMLAGVTLELDPGLPDALAALDSVRAENSACHDATLKDGPLRASDPRLNAGAGDMSNVNQRSQESTLPIVRVQPQYPRKAADEKMNGQVVVELTINEDGSVDKNSIIIIKASPEGYFEAAATRAASMFKYKPRMVNGKAQKVEGVRYKFTFEIK